VVVVFGFSLVPCFRLAPQKHTYAVLFCLPIDPVSIYVSDMCTLQRDYVVAFSTTLRFRAGWRAAVDLNVRCAGTAKILGRDCFYKAGTAALAIGFARESRFLRLGTLLRKAQLKMGIGLN
jgi:hypothetical protein